MARKRNIEVPADDLVGTVEGQAAAFFEREKAAYEERTGREVKYVPPVPTTRTPLTVDSGQGTVDSGEKAQEEEGEASE